VPRPCRALLLALLVPILAACPGGSGGGGAVVPSGTSLDVVMTHADSAYREGDYAEAQKAYQEALAIAPENDEIVAKLATCYLQIRVNNQAQDLLTAHLEKRPGDAASRLVLARVYIRKAQFDDAARELERVLQDLPDSLLAQYNLGFMMYRRRNYEAAEKHLLKTIELSPDHPEAHYTLGLVYRAQNRLDESIRELERAVEIDPRHIGARFNLANAYARAGRQEDSRRQQQAYAEISGRGEAAEERNTQIGTSSVKALQLLTTRQYPEALAEYRSLVDRFPDHAPLYNEIGRIQIKLGDHAAALEALRKAMELDPRLSEPHYLLSGLYREQGDEAAAERELGIFATLESIPEGKARY